MRYKKVGAMRTSEVSSVVATRLRVLFAALDDDEAQTIRRLLTASESHPFEVVYASSGWVAAQHSTDGVYAALLFDSNLADTDTETLLERLRANGVGAPALVLIGPDKSAAAASGGDDDRLPRTEALSGNTLVRAIMAMVQRHQLTNELVAARAAAGAARATLAEFAHDLATPLGVIVGMTQLVLANDYGLNAEGRACLEDVALGAARAHTLLNALNVSDTGVQATSPVHRAPNPVQVPPQESGRRTVLIADDDAATRRLVRTILASDLYTVLEAADGEEAWRMIRQHHPAVAILDWQMPIYSGLELTDVIKSDPQVQGMTVIMLTGRTAAADRAAGALARADLYLTKPFSSEELLHAVGQALGIVR